MRKLICLLMLAFITPSMIEAQPAPTLPRKEPDPLKYKLPDPLPDSVLADAEKLVKPCVGATGPPSSAEKALVQKGPLAAVLIEAYLKKEQQIDGASRKRLEFAGQKAMSDSVANAKVIMEYGKIMQAVGGNLGTHRPTEAIFVAQRSQAKLFDYFFIDPKPYSEEINGKEFGKSDKLNVGADVAEACRIYEAAATMYERMALKERNPAVNRQHLANATDARNRAAALAKVGAGLK